MLICLGLAHAGLGLVVINERTQHFHEKIRSLFQTCKIMTFHGGFGCDGVGGPLTHLEPARIETGETRVVPG